jgi:hypothetical protein
MDLSGPPQAILAALYFAGLQDTGFSLTHLEPIFSVQDMVARGAQHCNSLLLPLCAA